MKKITIVLSAFILATFFGCQIESLDPLVQEAFIKGANSKVKSSTTVTTIEEYTPQGEACYTTNLIAGQHYTAGTVSIYSDGENLIIEYATTGDWTIGTTHLSVGDCEDGWVPLTHSGNPKVGNFEYTEPSYSDSQVVVYIISLESLGIEEGDTYCFAAHAEVDGPQGGQTAWGEGTSFDGHNWGMFVETSFTDCTGDDGDGGDGGPK